MSLVHLFPKQLEKLNTQLAEAEAALEARKKPPEENGPKIVGEGLVIDEWVYLFSSLLPFSSSVFSFIFCSLVLKSIHHVFLAERAEGKIPCATAG
jgi:hypothetical protein